MKPAHTRQIGKHLKAIGDIFEASADEADNVVVPPVVDVPPIVTVPPVIVTTQKRQLTGADLVYSRTIRLPMVDGLRNACGGFGVRVVDGKRLAIIPGNKNQGDAFIVDLDAGEEGVLSGRIVDYHNGGTGMHVGDPAGDPFVEPTGATYDEDMNELIWTFHDPYSFGKRDDFSWGVTDLSDGSVGGPYRAGPTSHKTCGYPVLLPNGVICFGAGLTSGNAGSSWGPCLYDHGVALIEYNLTNRCRRNADYKINAGDPNAPDIAPDANGGFWTQSDFINGACAIDLPDVSGLLFCGHQGRGQVWYGGPDQYAAQGIHDAIDWKGPHAERRMPLFWIVNLENPNPVQVEEVDLPNIAVGQFPVLSGSWCDVANRELFVCAPNADYSRGLNGSLGLLHVWKIK